MRKGMGKKIMKYLALIVVACLAIVAAGAWNLFGTQLKAAQTVTKLEDGLYTMTYVGDYGFQGFLDRGGAESDAKMAEYITEFLTRGFYKAGSTGGGEFACSALTAENGIFGRNYDWDQCTGMVVRTKPEDGYESISTVCLEFLGFGPGWKPEGMPNQFMALAAVYLPLDGMNEKGLCIADLMAGDDEVTNQDTGKPDLTTVSAIRLVLDRAADVEEAVALLKAHDMHSSIGSAHHFAISDAAGRSVVVEWIGGEMFVTDTDIVTNHYLTPGEKFGQGGEGEAESHVRFRRLEERRSQSGTVAGMKETLAQNSYENRTQWSIVYDKEARVLDLYWQTGFDKAYSFRLGE